MSDLDNKADEWTAALESAAEQMGADVVEVNARKRGKPASKLPTKDPAPKVNEVITPERIRKTIGPLLRITCDIFDVQRPDETELTDFSEGIAPCAEKYMPEIMQNRAEEILAIVAVISISAPRVDEYLRKKAAAKPVEPTTPDIPKAPAFTSPDDF